MGGGAGAEVVVTAEVLASGVLATVESPELQLTSTVASATADAAAVAAMLSRCHTPADGTVLCGRNGVTARVGIRLQIQ